MLMQKEALHIVSSLLLCTEILKVSGFQIGLAHVIVTPLLVEVFSKLLICSWLSVRALGCQKKLLV